MAPLTEQERKTLVRLLNKIAGQPAPSSHDRSGRESEPTAV